MRTYDIIDDITGVTVGSQECEDSMAPVRRSGQSARLTHIDGSPVQDASGFQALSPDPVVFEPPATVGQHPDDAHPGTQAEPSAGAPSAT